MIDIKETSNTINVQKEVPTSHDGYNGEIITGIISEDGRRLIGVKYEDGWYFTPLDRLSKKPVIEKKEKTSTTVVNNVSSGGGGASVEDDVYGVGWNGDTANAPSQNAVYDKISSIDTTLGSLSSSDISDVSANADQTSANTCNNGSLSNVDNTSDLNKPVSTAIQTALDLKLDLAGGIMTSHVDFGDNKLTNLQRAAFNDGDGYISEIIDNHDMSSTGSTKVSSSESIKAYADSLEGRVVGYSHFYNQSIIANYGRIEISGSAWALCQTAQGTGFKIDFTVPSSGNVEISLTCHVLSTNDYLRLALSDSNSTFNSVNTYGDYNEFIQYGDESDSTMVTVRWVLTGLTSGGLQRLYVWGKTNGSLNKAYIYHGKNYHHGATYYNPPITIKTIVLPATMNTGG